MRPIAATLLLAMLLAGCGQTGPLYMPGEAAATDRESSADSEPRQGEEAAADDPPAPITEVN